MNINDILTDAEEDVEQICMALTNVRSVLQDAAYDYAHAALSAANETVKCVQNAAPCVAVWPHIAEYQKYIKKAYSTLEATTQATGMLLMAEETGDDFIDELNSDAKVASIEVHVVSSMIEGANLRINLALQGVPQNGAPGQRCNPKVFEQNPPPED